MLSDKKILVTGATGQVGQPIALRLAGDNEVWCPARFSAPDVRERLEASGITTCTWNLESPEFDRIPDDFTHVIHSAVIMTDGHEDAVRLNVESTATLMRHCHRAEGFLYVSASAVYQRLDPAHPHREDDPVGGIATYRPSYPGGKLTTEGAVRAGSVMLDLPATIARLNVAYGPFGHGGLPAYYYQLMAAGQPILVPPGHDNHCAPLHTDDIAEQAGKLLAVATVPATTVNWGGDENVSQRDIAEYVGELAGFGVRFQTCDTTFDSFSFDNARRRSLIGNCRVPWRDGISQLVGALRSGEFAPQARPKARI